ncbi:MAG: carbamoyltransferase C-terminal domain-containing protein [Elusimicrobiota bacterium]|jgi:carbamoyltransferase
MPGSDAILGVWDGHDSGAALLVGGRLVAAANEERFTRRKLEIHFPEASIRFCLAQAGLEPGALRRAAFSTADPSRALTRWLPSLKEENYLLRRRKVPPGWAAPLKRRFKFWVNELRPCGLSRALSRLYAVRRLRALGLRDFELSFVDHHLCHAHAAAAASGSGSCVVVTLDGIGDGDCGGVWVREGGKLRELARFDGRTSLGIFFETLTHLLNMREVEDEGKVMALADYALPVPDSENPMLGFFKVSGLSLTSPWTRSAMQAELGRIVWRHPPDQAAFMAQRLVEKLVPELFRNAMKVSGLKDLAYAGGLAANVKVNRLLRERLGARSLSVFPHMGDGGLAAGAAWACASELGQDGAGLPDVFLGPGFTDGQISVACRAFPGLRLEPVADPARCAAALVAEGKIVLWFQGRMEYGPRALGGRSILARPDSTALKDELNLKLKRRAWYQPFCPSVLESEADALFEEYRGAADRFMTVAYMVRPERRRSLAGVISVDGTCRPQIAAEDGSLYGRFLQELKALTGLGACLNTSFNIHGEPMVCSPEDAFRAFSRMPVDDMLIGGWRACKSRPV